MTNDVLVLEQKDIDSRYSNITKKIDIFNLSKSDISTIYNALLLLTEKEKTNKKAIKLLKKYSSYLNTMNKK